MPSVAEQCLQGTRLVGIQEDVGQAAGELRAALCRSCSDNSFTALRPVRLRP